METPQKRIELKQIKQKLKSLRFRNMNHAKTILVNLCVGNPFPTVNRLLHLLGENDLSFGDNYVWVNLGWDLLSNKYGAFAIYHPDTNHTEFALHMPVPKLLSEIKAKDIDARFEKSLLST